MSSRSSGSGAGRSGGAGTVVFNIGLGWFEDDAFVFEQLFLREFGEEPGRTVAGREAYARADQFFVNTSDKAFNNRATFFVLAIEDEDAGLKVEDDHTLVWLEPHEAVELLRHAAHAWAVAAWLRLRRKA